jgi:hypothetical protein
MRKEWKFFNRHITPSEVNQLRAAHIEVFVGNDPPPIEIATTQSIIKVDLFLPNIAFYTTTEKQETLLALMFGNSVQLIGYLDDQLYY